MMRYTFRNTENGQALVETALIITLLLVLLLGIVEVAWMGHAFVTLSHGSREGVRQLAVGKKDSEITAYINSQLPSLNKDAMNIMLSPPENQRRRGDTGTVIIEYTMDPIFLNFIFSSGYSLQGETSMRIEQEPAFY